MEIRFKALEAECRNDGSFKIGGYVNVTERESELLYSGKRGKWFNEVVKEETTTGYTTYYRYADRSMNTTYYYEKTETRETLIDPSGQDGVSNVVKYVKYIEK